MVSLTRAVVTCCRKQLYNILCTHIYMSTYFLCCTQFLSWCISLTTVNSQSLCYIHYMPVVMSVYCMLYTPCSIYVCRCVKHVLTPYRTDPFCDNEVADRTFGCTLDRGSIAKCSIVTLSDDVIADYRVCAVYIWLYHTCLIVLFLHSTCRTILVDLWRLQITVLIIG